MKLRELKQVLNDLMSVLDDKNVKKEVGKTYKYINQELAKDLNSSVNATFSGTAKQIQVDIILNKKDKNKIINSKVKRKTIFDRITINGKKLTKDIKKIGLDNKLNIKKRFNREYNNTKRIIRTDSHRILERTKNFCNSLANKAGFETKGRWICSFKNSRDAHIRMHNQINDSDGYFSIDGFKTKYPGGFGVAKLDINCHCKVKYERMKNNE